MACVFFLSAYARGLCRVFDIIYVNFNTRGILIKNHVINKLSLNADSLLAHWSGSTELSIIYH
jgi:hypothetical protein